jgi:hypothetical protein
MESAMRVKSTAAAITCMLVPLLYSEVARGQVNTQVPTDPHTASLVDVTRAVTSILDEVKSDPAFQSGPQLAEAEFDYQTVSATTATGGIGILGILTLGASRERDTTSETDFIYDVPSTTNENHAAFIGGWLHKIKDFFAHNDSQQILAKASQVLPAAIKQAAASMQLASKVINPTGKDLTVRTYVITLAFSVKDDFNGGEDVSSLVVVAPKVSFDHSKQNVQTLKLTFKDKSSNQSSQ